MESLRQFVKLFVSICCLVLCVGVAYAAQSKQSLTTKDGRHYSFSEIRQAALGGDRDAEYALGYMYFYGQGTSRNEMLARKWIKRSANQGQPQARRAIQMLAANTVSRAASRAQAKPTPKAKTQLASNRVSSSASLSEKRFTLAEKRLIRIPRSHYTIQLMAAEHKTHIARYMAAHQIKGAQMYHTTRHGKPWYVLIYGNYTSKAVALAARRKLPASVRRSKPWPKSFASVRRQLRKG